MPTCTKQGRRASCLPRQHLRNRSSGDCNRSFVRGQSLALARDDGEDTRPDWPELDVLLRGTGTDCRSLDLKKRTAVASVLDGLGSFQEMKTGAHFLDEVEDLARLR